MSARASKMTGSMLTTLVVAFLGFHRQYPVKVEVRDAETGGPIPDARIELHSICFMNFCRSDDHLLKSVAVHLVAESPDADPQ